METLLNLVSAVVLSVNEQQLELEVCWRKLKGTSCLVES